MSNRPLTAQLLRSRGMRPTRRRIALLDALLRAQKPLSAEELHAHVKADLVTIYRTLQNFIASKLVREVRFKDTRVRYECAQEAHHHHLVCTRCGKVDELPNCRLESLERDVLKISNTFARIDEHALEFFGTCVTCAKR